MNDWNRLLGSISTDLHVQIGTTTIPEWERNNSPVLTILQPLGAALSYEAYGPGFWLKAWAASTECVSGFVLDAQAIGVHLWSLAFGAVGEGLSHPAESGDYPRVTCAGMGVARSSSSILKRCATRFAVTSHSPEVSQSAT